MSNDQWSAGAAVPPAEPVGPAEPVEVVELSETEVPVELVEHADVVVEHGDDAAVVHGLAARFGVEFLGTFMLVLFGVGAALYAATSAGVGVLGVALAFGVAVIAGASAWGHISGGHFNPAVTIGTAVAGRTPWRDVPAYIVAQVLGGTGAAAVLFVIATRLPALQQYTTDGVSVGIRAFFSGASNGFDAHSPIASVAGGQGFDLVGALLMETVVTAIFVGVILGVTGKAAAGHLAPVVIGLTLAFLIAITIPVTNASLNPARSLATALFSDGWALGQVWVFWVAPILGAVIAGLLYRSFTPVDEIELEDEEV